jgi:hypothetical protein
VRHYDCEGEGRHKRCRVVVGGGVREYASVGVPYPVVQVAVVEGWRECSVEIQKGS